MSYDVQKRIEHSQIHAGERSGVAEGQVWPMQRQFQAPLEQTGIHQEGLAGNDHRRIADPLVFNRLRGQANGVETRDSRFGGCAQALDEHHPAALDLDSSIQIRSWIPADASDGMTAGRGWRVPRLVAIDEHIERRRLKLDGLRAAGLFLQQLQAIQPGYNQTGRAQMEPGAAGYPLLAKNSSSLASGRRSMSSRTNWRPGRCHGVCRSADDSGIWKRQS